MQYYIALSVLFLLVLSVIIKVNIMRRKEGIKAFFFGVTDKRDYFIVPFILLLFYQVYAKRLILK